MARKILKNQSLKEQVSVSSAQAIRKSTLDESERKSIKNSLLESAKASGNKKLIEATRKLTEQQLGKSKWSFPISRYDHINVNRRNYPKGLWERVIKEQQHVWEGGTGLADHPGDEEDPKFKDTSVVWSNLRMDESNNLVWADAVFVGENGRLAEEILENDGKVGFSTAGMGDLERVTENRDGGLIEFYNVVPEEFILERVADIVHNPSQDVYGFLDMKISEAGDIDAGTAQKMHPHDDQRPPATGSEDHPPLQGEEAEIPEFNETNPLDEPYDDEMEMSDTSQVREAIMEGKEDIPAESKEKASEIIDKLRNKKATREEMEWLEDNILPYLGFLQRKGAQALISASKGAIEAQKEMDAESVQESVRRMKEAGTTDDLNTNAISSYVKKLKDADKVWIDGDGSVKYSKGGNSHNLNTKTRAELASRGLKEEGDAAVGMTSSNAQANAPENATKVTEPGRKKDEDYGEAGEQGQTDMKENKPTFSSYEERRAYEDIVSFLERADKMDSVHERLREYKEIATYINDVSVGKYLREAVRTRISNAQKEIAELTETGQQFRRVFGTDLSVKDLQGAVHNFSEVKENLTENSYDWKKVATKMANQLRKFVEAVQVLKERPTIEAHENLQKRAQKIQETMTSKMKNHEKSYKNKLQGLQNDLTKAHEALRKSVQEKKKLESQYKAKLKELQEKNKKLAEANKRIKESSEQMTHELMDENTKYLFEGAKGVESKAQNYQAKNRRITEEATDKYRRQGKQEVKEYYDQLLRKHGSAIVPYSQQILECNSYKEAVNKFMEIMDEKVDVGPEQILDLDNPMIYEALQGWDN